MLCVGKGSESPLLSVSFCTFNALLTPGHGVLVQWWLTMLPPPTPRRRHSPLWAARDQWTLQLTLPQEHHLDDFC